MPKFAYKAIDERGANTSGVIEAASPDAAKHLLISQGNIPISVSLEKSSSKSGSGGLHLGARVKLQDLLLFTKQMRTMMRAGISVTRTFEVLQEQSENQFLKQTLKTMLEDIKEGSSLFMAFKKHPKIFPDLYCSLISAGELSGSLSDILERACYLMEHEQKVREDVKAALAYPKMVLMALSGAFFFLLTFVIPKFVSVFSKAGLDLPLPTKICLWLYSSLSTYWHILLGLAIALFFGLRAFFKTPAGALLRDGMLLRLPIIGHLFIKTAMSRFASILSILMASGVAILESIRIISETIGNAAITREFSRLKDQMEEGRGIALPLRTAKYFPPMVINMITIGEESGTLEEMLNEVARHYDEEVQYATKGLSEAIAPILIVGLTAVVGFFALAIFLPMWDLTKMAK